MIISQYTQILNTWLKWAGPFLPLPTCLILTLFIPVSWSFNCIGLLCSIDRITLFLTQDFHTCYYFLDNSLHLFSVGRFCLLFRLHSSAQFIPLWLYPHSLFIILASWSAPVIRLISTCHQLDQHLSDAWLAPVSMLTNTWAASLATVSQLISTYQLID